LKFAQRAASAAKAAAALAIGGSKDHILASIASSTSDLSL
jgi:hypothetical protein